MVDVSKLISFENLLVRKVTWFMLSTTSAPLILSCTFGTDHMTRISHIYSWRTITHSLFHFDFQRQHSFSSILTSRDSTLSLFHFDYQRQHSFSSILTTRDSTLSLPFWLLETALFLFHFDFQRQHSFSSILTTRDSLALPASDIQLNTRNIGAYILCDFFLSCSAFSTRLVQVLLTASDILSNPERDKRPAWEKIRLSKIHL